MSAKKIGAGRDARKKREDRVGSRRKWERYIVLHDMLQHKESSTAEKEAEMERKGRKAGRSGSLSPRIVNSEDVFIKEGTVMMCSNFRLYVKAKAENYP